MTDTPAPADGTRWRGFAHKDLYLMLHDGPGAGASAEPSRRWGEVAATLTEIGQDLQKALDLTGSGWAGRAAGAAYNRLSTTVKWANATGAGAATMRTSIEDQGDHIAKARADMPRPEDVPAAQPDPTAAPAVQIIQAQTDAEPAETAAASAEERAVEVMTTYETNTNATTGALPAFEAPEKLLPDANMHQGQGRGLLGIATTVVSGLTGGGQQHHDDRRAETHGNQRGGGQTSGAAAMWDEPTGRRMPNAPAPGKIMGVATDPFFAPGGGGYRVQDRASSRGGTGGSGGGGGGGTPGPGAKSGTGGMAPHEMQQAQQAAAASQAAASAHPAGAPMAPGTGPVGSQDKMGARRFGMDAIGSSQWFGDTEEPVPGESQKRRFDLRESAEANESATILDQENQLPPNVIGEGGR